MNEASSVLTPAPSAVALDAQARSRTFFGELESLRGLAALLVVVYHMPNWYDPFYRSPIVRNGHGAVEFFFVLSGFVLYHSYGLRIPDLRALKRFTLLRFGRLYPVHFVFAMAFFGIELAKLMGGMGGANSPSSMKSLLRALVENLLLVQGLGLAPREVFLNFPSWSISTEFYTYLIFGVAAWLLSRRSFVVFSLLLTATCCGVLTVAAQRIGETHQLLRCVAGFFLGCLTRIAYANMKPWNSKMDWTLLLLLVSAVFLNIGWEDRLDAWQIAFPLSVSVILTLLLTPPALSHRMLASRPFRWLGEISYSLYMCHALVLYLARHALHVGQLSLPAAIALYIAVVGAVILTGWITYRLVEQPSKSWLRKLAGGNSAA